jgi:hypothetical protein
MFGQRQIGISGDGLSLVFSFVPILPISWLIVSPPIEEIRR